MPISRMVLNRLRFISTNRFETSSARYGLAMLGIGAVATLQIYMLGSSAPWFLYTPAVVLLTVFLGPGPGAFATFLSAFCAGYVVLDNDNRFLLTPAHWAASVFFVVTTLGLVGLVMALRRALLESEMLRAERDDELVHTADREAFLAGVLSSSTDCIKVLDLDGRLTFMSEGGKRVMEVSDFNIIAGCPWPDFWGEEGNTSAREAVEAARHGEARSFIGKAETPGGTAKWWHVAVSPILGMDGKPDRILSVSRDITDLRRSEEERDRFVRLSENSTDFIGMAHVDGTVFYMNDAARRLVGLEGADISKLAITDFFPPDLVEKVRDEVLPCVDEEGSWAGDLQFRHFVTGELIPVHYAVFPITDEHGKLIGYGTVTRDNREVKRAEENMRMLNEELAHRLKNVLAVVQSITQQTLRKAPDKETAGKDLSARLMALGTATDVLTNSSWRSAELVELATRTLSMHGRIGEKILVDGPQLMLKPGITVGLSLALHELATNAAKYGALSTDAGIVSLTWTISGEGEDADFAMRWEERGGPPVSPPERFGFGSLLIDRSLRSYFKGKAETLYLPEGLVFELESRLQDAALVSGI